MYMEKDGDFVIANKILPTNLQFFLVMLLFSPVFVLSRKTTNTKIVHAVYPTLSQKAHLFSTFFSAFLDLLSSAAGTSYYLLLCFQSRSSSDILLERIDF